jgi:hypothetical protein
VLASLREGIVPGSSRVNPAVYIDARLARMTSSARDSVPAAAAAVSALADVTDAGGEVVGTHASTAGFLRIRTLALEDFYSGFVAKGASGPDASAEVDFSSPLATRLAKGWNYQGSRG